MSADNSEQQGVSIAKFSAPTVERPRWLWPQRIPLGCLTLLAGEPAAGKSSLTLDLAVRVSNGSSWPGASDDEKQAGVKLSGCGSVLMICFEDGWRETVRPRLGALGADLSKIKYLPISDQQPTDMRIETLQHDLYRLQDCRLIVIDPISAFLNELGGKSGSKGRRLVYLLTECVRFKTTALVLVTHLQTGKGKALHLPSGNDALIRAARAAWLLTNDRAEPDRRLFLSIKNNLGPPPSGLAFTFQPAGDGEFASLQWEDEPVPLSADEFLREAVRQSPPRDHKLLSAVEWLQAQLRDGPQPAGEIQQQAKVRGISYGTLRRAFRELGIKSLQQPRDAKHPFIWQLDGLAKQAYLDNTDELSNSASVSLDSSQ